MTLIKNHTILLLLTLFVFTSCKKNNEEEKTVEPDVKVATVKPRKIKVVLSPESNTNASGKVMLKTKNNSVTITAIVSGLTPGEHALYIQDNTKEIDNNSKFIGKLIADENGNGTLSKTTEDWCIDCGENAKDISGKHIIVYTDVKNFISQSSSTTDTKVSCTGIIQ